MGKIRILRLISGICMVAIIVCFVLFLGYDKYLPKENMTGDMQMGSAFFVSFCIAVLWVIITSFTPVSREKGKQIGGKDEL